MRWTVDGWFICTTCVGDDPAVVTSPALWMDPWTEQGVGNAALLPIVAMTRTGPLDLYDWGRSEYLRS